MEQKSLTKSLLYRTELAVWERGQHYADSGNVNVLKITDKEIEANVAGTKVYKVILKFVGTGIRKICSCPYPAEVCKHKVAAAIIWDKRHGIQPPTPEQVKTDAILPSPISRKDINNMFKKPLNVDLDLLRIVVDFTAFSSKEHARLPKSPKIELSEIVPLQHDEVKSAFKEIERWSKRPRYDSYFCAGEMSAAFCELLDVIKKREPSSNPQQVILIIAYCIDWYYRKFHQMVDGSDGVWIFPYVRIGHIVSLLTQKYLSDISWLKFRQIVQDAGNWWGEPDLDENIIASWKDCLL